MKKKIWWGRLVVGRWGLGWRFVGVVMWIMEVKGYKKWRVLLEWLGVNGLLMYVVGGVVGIVLGRMWLGWGEGRMRIEGFV